ncbi:MAG: endolytic transglycosylase MltG [Candidatus Pacebacteria bacterium]|nr:endolytic transglycosylase MltG [Candidatus Paceibacterota bacterium]MBP9818748.1 endolytic transglycosylase MltG [Candidatus Paceibacterota bacterium]
MFTELSMHEVSLVKKIVFGFIVLAFIGITTLLSFFLFVVRAPSGVQYPVKITVESGQGAQSIAQELFEHGIVRQSKFTQNLIVSKGGEKSIQAGTYIFKKPMYVFSVAEKIATGDFGYVPVKMTVPEGTNSKRLAVIIHSKFPHIATSTFETLARENEGYLFPETYFFAPEATELEILDRMKVIFNRKIEPIKPQIVTSGKTLSEILTIASILEGEVQTAEDRAMVADLLERRMQIGMPLQVDATLVYTTGKTSATLTLKDLQTNGPYNTYTNKGLPPTPISNPGLDSILAVLNPIPNQYLFYLSDKDGITRFSKTYAEHLKLKAKYLR